MNPLFIHNWGIVLYQEKRIFIDCINNVLKVILIYIFLFFFHCKYI